MTRKIRPMLPRPRPLVASHHDVHPHGASVTRSHSEGEESAMRLLGADEGSLTTSPAAAAEHRTSAAIWEALIDQRLDDMNGASRPDAPRHLTLESSTGTTSEHVVQKTMSKVHHHLGISRDVVAPRRGE